MFPSQPVRKFLPGLLAAMLAACGAPTAAPTPTATFPSGTTPTPSLEPTPTESIVSLRLWLPESLAPLGDGEGARILTQQLGDFDARQPDATLAVAPKKDHGPGGLLDLLRAASPVAPAALPDLILLDDADLAIAAREGLIQPLDNALGADSEAVLFAFARTAARIDGKRMGLPLVVDFDHLVFVPERLDDLPANWSDLIDAALPFPFAFATGSEVSDAVLAQYQQLGGTIINAEGQPALSLDALTQLLTLYRDARDAGSIAASNLEWTSAEAVWTAFRASDAPLTITRASRYLSIDTGDVALDFARMPAVDGQTVPSIGRAWILAVVTSDPRRQALAVELIKHLSQPDNLAAWTQAARILPANAEALAIWSATSGYVAFARGELNRAQPPMSPAALEAVSPAFLTAIDDLLAGRATPQAAAAAAVESVADGGN